MAEKFARYHPQVSIRLRDDTHLTTDAFDVAIAAGDIDLIPSARELVPSETERLTGKLGGPPVVVAVATGSYATKSGTHALAFYVNAANPLERLVDGVRIGEDVVGGLPIGVLVGGAKARDSECRRISKCSTEVGGRGPVPRRSCERINDRGRIVA